MKVADLMTPEPVTIPRDETLLAAVVQMRFHDVGSLPVVDPSGVVLGMITDRDVALSALKVEGSLAGLYVADVMSRTLHACHAGDTIRHAEELMRKYRVRRLPVIDERGAPLGILSLADLALAASDTLHIFQARDLARLVAALSTPKVPPERHDEKD